MTDPVDPLARIFYLGFWTKDRRAAKQGIAPPGMEILPGRPPGGIGTYVWRDADAELDAKRLLALMDNGPNLTILASVISGFRAEIRRHRK
jgi:hypothetical protein